MISGAVAHTGHAGKDRRLDLPSKFILKVDFDGGGDCGISSIKEFLLGQVARAPTDSFPSSLNFNHFSFSKEVR